MAILDESAPPVRILRRCDICHKVVPQEEIFSYMTALVHIPGGYPGYACPHRQNPQQHFGCTYEHALLADLICIFEHLHNGPHPDSGKDFAHPFLVQLQQDIAALEAEIVAMRSETTPDA